MGDTPRKRNLIKQESCHPHFKQDLWNRFRRWVEKNWFWLHVGTAPFDLLSLAIAVISKHKGLPQRPTPLCLAVKLKCLCSAHRETIWPFPPMKGRDEHTPSKGWPLGEMFYKTEDAFYFSSSLSLALSSVFWLESLIASLRLVLYKNQASGPWQDDYLETLVCHLLGQPTFWMRSYTLPQYLISWIHWPVGNTARESMHHN